MKLHHAYRIQLCNLQGYIDGMIKMNRSGKIIEKYADDSGCNVRLRV